MDPIGAIKPAKDTTLAMLLAAQARGFELPTSSSATCLAARRRGLRAHAPLTVRADPRTGSPSASRHEPLGARLILMRKDPPFDTEYIYSTYILERAEQAGVLVVNRPQGLRDMNEKVYTAWFPQCCAPTLITRDMADMRPSCASTARSWCKPLHGMGGRSIFVLEQGDKNANVVFETLTDYGQRFAIAQRYMPEIVDDGRRARAAGRRRAGALRAGAHSLRERQPRQPRRRRKGVGRPLNERDRWLAAQIGPALRERGMLFVGLDVIGGFVTEINVTSPTGIRELESSSGSTSAAC